MAKQKEILVRAATSQEDADRSGWDLVDPWEGTMKDARRRAKYVLTEEYQNVCESSTPLTYSQVVVDGEVIDDYFA